MAGPVRRYAMGVPVWVGKDEPQTLWAVVCPVASRIGPAVRGYIGDAQVIVTEGREAQRVSAALGRGVRTLSNQDSST